MEVFTALVLVCNSTTMECTTVSSMDAFFTTLFQCEQWLARYVEALETMAPWLTVATDICHNWGQGA